jgi:hypothetical protein
MTTDPHSRPHGQADAQLEGRYWPAEPEPPRRRDGTIDIRALCRRWDDEANQ